MYKRTSNFLGTCSKYDFDTNDVVECDSFVYDTSQMSRTLITDLDLVCDQASLKRHFTTALLIGLFFGSLIGGRLGDRFGRKKGAAIAVSIIIPSVVIGGLIPNYYVYLLLRLEMCDGGSTSTSRWSMVR